MAASTHYGKSLNSTSCRRRYLPTMQDCFQHCRQLLVVVGTIFLMVQCICGHSFNENLFMEILHPEDISYTYKIRPARTFGGVFNSVVDNVYLVPTDPHDGCGELVNAGAVMNNVAFIERGQCSFMSKAIVAERSGAIAVVIYDNDEKNDWAFIDMIEDGSDRLTNIPAVFLLGRDGHNIKRSISYHHLQGAEVSLPINITGIPIGHINRAPWSLL